MCLVMVHQKSKNSLNFNEMDIKGAAQVIFSPSHQSFDQFKNFMERGDTFKDLVVKKYC